MTHLLQNVLLSTGTLYRLYFFSFILLPILNFLKFDFNCVLISRVVVCLSSIRVYLLPCVPFMSVPILAHVARSVLYGTRFPSLVSPTNSAVKQLAFAKLVTFRRTFSSIASLLLLICPSRSLLPIPCFVLLCFVRHSQFSIYVSSTHNLDMRSTLSFASLYLRLNFKYIIKILVKYST